jgi:hypothetical protein
MMWLSNKYVGQPHFVGSCIRRAILRLLAVAESGAYLAYVSISAARQMPKEPLYVDFYFKKGPPAIVRGEPYVYSPRV